MKILISSIFVWVVLFSCSTNSESISSLSNSDIPQIESLYSKVVSQNSSESALKKFIRFANYKELKMKPDEVYFNGEVLLDDGKGNDEIQGDGIFTAISSTSTKDNDIHSLKVGSRILHFSKDLNSTEFSKDRLLLRRANTTLDRFPFEAFWFLECEVDAVAPGADCLGQKCPEKSAFGGKTWFCICTRNCKLCLGGDCGDKK